MSISIRNRNNVLQLMDLYSRRETWLLEKGIV